MYRIIIADDETFIQDAVARFIHTRLPEFQITGMYSNGSLALASFAEEPADIVITDIRMPIMDGLELVTRLRAEYPGCVPIIVSGYSEFSYAKTAMKAGVIHYLLKPLDFSELKQSLLAAAHTIDRNRLLKAETDYTQEETELFFIDLINGRLRDSLELGERFHSLKLPFPLKRSAGIMLRISPDTHFSESWNYGLETLHNAFCNIIRMLSPSVFVCPVYQTRKHYDILAIGSAADLPSSEEIANQCLEVLRLKSRISLLYSFASIEDLGNHVHLKIPEETAAFCGNGLAGSQKTAAINRAITFITENYAKDLTREDAAGAVFMSGAYFSRCFKEVTGVSFLDYLTDLRMRKAIELLNTNMKIQEIGKTVGYQSKNRFLVNFRHYTSYTPSQYRRDVLKIME